MLVSYYSDNSLVLTTQEVFQWRYMWSGTRLDRNADGSVI